MRMSHYDAEGQPCNTVTTKTMQHHDDDAREFVRYLDAPKCAFASLSYSPNKERYYSHPMFCF